jgi:hypothetical protein
MLVPLDVYIILFVALYFLVSALKTGCYGNNDIEKCKYCKWFEFFFALNELVERMLLK